MQMKELNKSDQKLIDKIIRVAYGDAGIFDWLHIRLKSLSNNDIKSLLVEYRQTANVVHKLKGEEVPGHITERIKDITSGTIKSESLTSKISFAIFSFFGSKAIPAAIIGILIIVIVSMFIFKKPTPTHKYSKAEIELAQRQFQKSLAIVGKTFQKAEKSFSEDVLKNQINKNLNRGYYLVNNILIGG
jgi:hypothetical protein